jgi:hypothetical protein
VVSLAYKILTANHDRVLLVSSFKVRQTRFFSGDLQTVCPANRQTNRQILVFQPESAGWSRNQIWKKGMKESTKKSKKLELKLRSELRERGVVD